jgi:hypothetical protein
MIEWWGFVFTVIVIVVIIVKIVFIIYIIFVLTIILWTSVLSCPLKTGEMAVYSGSLTSIGAPVAAILSQPLED